jgi:hypothetical protein
MEPPPARQCPYCQQSFIPSRFRRSQQVCSSKPCQNRRKAESHRARIAKDPLYAASCRDAQHHWRKNHPDYQRQYRQDHPLSAKRNRDQQQQRDVRRKIAHLVKNNLALDLTASISNVFLVGPAASVLDKNHLASSKLLIYQPAPVPTALLEKNNLAC